MVTQREAVRKVQVTLTAETGRPLAIDGIWGIRTNGAYVAAEPSTKAKVEASLAADGYTVDGVRRLNYFSGDEGARNAREIKAGVSMAEVARLIREECGRRGYANPELVVAQAVHESRNGRSLLSAKYNNFSGLKVGVRPNRAIGTANLETGEGFGAKARTESATFLAFASPLDWVITHLDYLERKSQGAIKAVVTPKQYNDILVGAHYYTADPQVYLAALSRSTTALV